MALVGAGYSIAAARAAARLLRRAAEPLPPSPPALTVLKPLCGAEPGLEAALTSLLAQDYPAPVQVLFGVDDPADPALAVVRRLAARFPDADIAVTAAPSLAGANRKVAKLAAMAGDARHDVLVLADSDITVPPGYLAAVAAACARPGVGAVSCLYSGQGEAGIWSRLVAMAISYHFLPGAAFGIVSGLAHPCFGATIALRRDMLDAIGGFAAFTDRLADDYEIGQAVRARGGAIAYPALLVRHGCAETGAAGLATHELRWARTIRTIDPVGHWASAIGHPLAFALAGAALLGFAPAAVGGLLLVLGARLWLKGRVDRLAGAPAGPAWLLPLRDLLSFALFVASLTGRSVHWRGRRFAVRHGALQPAAGQEAAGSADARLSGATP